MDFAKGRLSATLSKEHPSVYKRYEPFKRLVEEVVLWRDAAVHRVTPLVAVASTKDPDSWFPRIRVLLEPDIDVPRFFTDPTPGTWVDPFYFYRRWQEGLLAFCGEVAADIASQTPPTTV